MVYVNLIHGAFDKLAVGKSGLVAGAANLTLLPQDISIQLVRLAICVPVQENVRPAGACYGDGGIVVLPLRSPYRYGSILDQPRRRRSARYPRSTPTRARLGALTSR